MNNRADELSTKLLRKCTKIGISKSTGESSKCSILSGCTNKLASKKADMSMAIVDSRNYFNDKNQSSSNDNDLDCLNNNHLTHRTAILANTKQQIKSTSFDSNLTDEHEDDDYNQSEPSVDSMMIIVNGDSRSSTLDEEEDEEDEHYKASEMSKLLDKSVCNDQKIVEVLRQLVRDCTNSDPTKRPSSFDVTNRLQPFLK